MTDPDWPRLGAAIAARRAELGMPRQADLAAAAGVSDTTWNMAEKGRAVGGRSLIKIAGALGWTSASPQAVLMGGDPELARVVTAGAHAELGAVSATVGSSDYNSRLARMPEHVLRAVNAIIEAEERAMGDRD